MSGDSKTGNKGKLALKIIIPVVAVILVAYVAGVVYAKGHFMYGTSINNTDVSYMTANKAEESVAKDAENYVLEIDFRNDKVEYFQGDEFGYTYVSDGSIDKLLDEQNEFLWFTYFFDKTEDEIPSNMKYDSNLLDGMVSSLIELDEEYMEAPVDAHITLGDDNKFTIVKESQGTTIAKDVLMKKLDEAILAREETINLDEVDGVYIKPEITDDNEELKKNLDKFTTMGNTVVNYILPDTTTATVDISVIKDWFDVDENGAYSYNVTNFNTKAIEYIANLAAQVNNTGQPRVFSTTGAGQVTVTGGEYGWCIDQDAELTQLVADIDAGTQCDREPIYSSREFADLKDNNGIGVSYVEIDVSRQHLWIYKEGNMVCETDIVSGLMTKEKYTPTGIYYIDYKQRDRVLKGERQPNGQYEYHTLVHYWLPFNGGIGMHDAYWKTKFGGTEYLTRGSHGCINLPKEIAPTIYDLVDTTMPVVVYNTQPYAPAG